MSQQHKLQQVSFANKHFVTQLLTRTIVNDAKYTFYCIECRECKKKQLFLIDHS